MTNMVLYVSVFNPIFTIPARLLSIRVYTFDISSVSLVALLHLKLNCFMLDQLRLLHGPSMFAVKAKIYGRLYNQASSIAFDETSSYWSALKSS